MKITVSLIPSILIIIISLYSNNSKMQINPRGKQIRITNQAMVLTRTMFKDRRVKIVHSKIKIKINSLLIRNKYLVFKKLRLPLACSAILFRIKIKMIMKIVMILDQRQLIIRKDKNRAILWKRMKCSKTETNRMKMTFKNLHGFSNVNIYRWWLINLF